MCSRSSVGILPSDCSLRRDVSDHQEGHRSSSTSTDDARILIEYAKGHLDVMTKRRQLLLQLLLVSFLNGTSFGGGNRNVLMLFQERIRTSSETTFSTPGDCNCTCGDHGSQNGSTVIAPLMNKNSSSNGSVGCGCGCGCCSTCSKFREKISINKKRSKPVKAIYIPPPNLQVCQALVKVYDDYQEVVKRRTEVEALKNSGSSLQSVVLITANRLYALALANYKFSWIQADLTVQLSGDSNATINDKCNDGCSDTTWKRGCTSCMPKINLNPTCHPPTEQPPPTTQSPAPYTGAPPPLNLSLCICARILIPPLEALLDALEEVDLKIKNTMAELLECRFREDALEKARELSITLEDLIGEMNLIVAQINSYTQQRSGRLGVATIEKVRAGVTSMKSSLIRKSSGGGGATCLDRGQTVIEHAKALQMSVKLFRLSPTNIEIQHTLHCRAYLTTTVIFKVIIGKIKLKEEEVRTLKGIFQELTSQHLASIDETIDYLFEWNTSRAETLEKMLEGLRREKENLQNKIPEKLQETS